MTTSDLTEKRLLLDASNITKNCEGTQPTWIWYSILVVASEYTQHSNPTDLHNSEAKMTTPKMCINDIGN
jgi:hypothetical protein